jgi:glutamine synthetase type III
LTDEEARWAQEDAIREQVDETGATWRKVYFGGGTHFENWLEQTIELRGRENVRVEEADATGLKCFEEGGEKMYRIWVREGSPA